MAEIRKLKNYINGEWVESKTDQYEDVVNPATKEVLCQVPISTKEDIDYAAQTAAEAFKTWSKVAVPRRARILFNFQQLLSQHKEELAHLITIENGKNTKEASLKSSLNIFTLMSQLRLYSDLLLKIEKRRAMALLRSFETVKISQPALNTWTFKMYEFANCLNQSKLILRTSNKDK